MPTEIRLAAYKPFEPIIIDETELEIFLFPLYEEAPVYEYDSQPTSAYKQQLDTIIDEIIEIIKRGGNAAALVADGEDLDGQIALFKDALTNVNYVSSNPDVQKAYYKTYKESLEKIYYITRNWESGKKEHFFFNLGVKIAACSTGAYTQLTKTVYELTTKPTITSWLAEFRGNIVHQIAEEFVTQDAVQENMSIHIHVFCLDHALKLGWNIPGYQKIEGYEDRYLKLKEQTAERYRKELERSFKAQFTKQAIIDNIVVNFNLLLAPYYDSVISPDLDDSIMSILDPFIKKGIFNNNAIYEYSDDNRWLINKEFRKNLPNYVETLLRKEGILEQLHLAKKLVETINKEIQRLTAKYSDNDERIEPLQRTLDFINTTIKNKLPEDVVLPPILSYINEHLIENNGLDKYKSWAEKFGLILLNILMVIPLGIPAVIKYATTGSAFFSTAGRTQELINDVYHEFTP